MPQYLTDTTADTLKAISVHILTGRVTKADAEFLRTASRAYEIMVDLLIRQRREIDELLGEIDELKADC